MVTIRRKKKVIRRYLSEVLPSDSRDSSRLTLPSVLAQTSQEYSSHVTFTQEAKKMLQLGLEPRLTESKPDVITTYTIGAKREY